jgi:hypothetical protein
MNEKIVELNGNVLKEDYLQKNFDFFYVGHLIDEPSDSFASGIVLDKKFYGTIKSKKLGNYYIEPAKRFSKNSTISHQTESIMYNEDQLRSERILKKRSSDESKSEPDVGSCGYDKVKKWMSKEQQNIYEEKMNNEVISKVI